MGGYLNAEQQEFLVTIWQFAIRLILLFSCLINLIDLVKILAITLLNPYQTSLLMLCLTDLNTHTTQSYSHFSKADTTLQPNQLPVAEIADDI